MLNQLQLRTMLSNLNLLESKRSRLKNQPKMRLMKTSLLLTWMTQWTQMTWYQSKFVFAITICHVSLTCKCPLNVLLFMNVVLINFLRCLQDDSDDESEDDSDEEDEETPTPKKVFIFFRWSLSFLGVHLLCGYIISILILLFCLFSNLKPESKKRAQVSESAKTPVSAKKAKIDTTTPQKTGTISLCLR